LDDVKAIENETQFISAVSPEVRSSGQVVFGNSNWPTSIYGSNGDYLSIKKIEIESGRIFTEREINSMAKVCLVGKTVVDELFGEGADPIGQTIRFKNSTAHYYWRFERALATILLGKIRTICFWRLIPLFKKGFWRLHIFNQLLHRQLVRKKPMLPLPNWKPFCENSIRF
jgi:hypothetical protein